MARQSLHGCIHGVSGAMNIHRAVVRLRVSPELTIRQSRAARCEFRGGDAALAQIARHVFAAHERRAQATHRRARLDAEAALADEPEEARGARLVADDGEAVGDERTQTGPAMFDSFDFDV